MAGRVRLGRHAVQPLRASSCSRQARAAVQHDAAQVPEPHQESAGLDLTRKHGLFHSVASASDELSNASQPRDAASTSRRRIYSLYSLHATTRRAIDRLKHCNTRSSSQIAGRATPPVQLQRAAPHARSGRKCSSSGTARKLQPPRAALQQPFATSEPFYLFCPLRRKHHVRAGCCPPTQPCH